MYGTLCIANCSEPGDIFKTHTSCSDLEVFLVPLLQWKWKKSIKMSHIFSTLREELLRGRNGPGFKRARENIQPQD